MEEKGLKVAAAEAVAVIAKVVVDVATVDVEPEKETRRMGHAGRATGMEGRASPTTLQATKEAPSTTSVALTLIPITCHRKRNLTSLLSCEMKP